MPAATMPSNATALRMVPAVRMDSKELRGEVRKRRTLALIAHFDTLLSDVFPKRYQKKISGEKVLFPLGSFYSEDHLDSPAPSVSWLCVVVGRTHHLLVARLLPRYAIESVTIEFSASSENIRSVLNSADFNRLRIQVGGAYSVKCRAIGQKSHGVGIAVRAISRMVDRGILQVPDVG